MPNSIKTIIIWLVIQLIGIPPFLHAQWIDSGVMICSVSADQENQSMTVDSVGGALLAWEDNRNGDTNRDIYVQRIDGNGYVLWGATGAACCQAISSQYYPEIISDGKDGGFVVWQDERNGNYDIYAQRIGSGGRYLWAEDGIPICTAGGKQRHPAIVTDGCNGVIIVWQDFRDGFEDYYAQRIDTSGVILWAENGIRFCASGGINIDANVSFPLAVSDGSGGAIVVWADRRNEFQFSYAQRINRDGEMLWAENGIRLSSNNTRSEDFYNLAPDGSGGAVFVWRIQGELLSSRYDIYAQRVLANGNVAWNPFGVEICVSPDWGCYWDKIILGNDSDIFVVWEDTRTSVGKVYAQKLDLSGNVQWAENGIPVCGGSEAQQDYPVVINDSGSGVLISWLDSRTQLTNDIIVQNLSEDGNINWDPLGVVVYHTEENWDQGDLLIVSDGMGGGIISWNERRGGYDDKLYAKRIYSDGSVPVPTFLQEYWADVTGDGVMLSWSISGNAGNEVFVVSRKDPGSPEYLEIQRITAGQNVYSFDYVDKTCLPGKSYVYRVAVEDDLETNVLFETQVLTVPPATLILYQNHPNPFNPSTTIEYYLPARSLVTLDIYDAAGKHVTRLIDGYVEPGQRRVLWDGTDSEGKQVSSGMYFYRLDAGKTTLSRKMMIIR